MLSTVISTTVLLLLASVARPAAADRPDGTSICDYYAQQQYQANNVTTQLKLMSSIVAYAYAGGRTVPNPPQNSTGIFNVGAYEDTQVYLRPWFDGTKNVTNFNDQAVAINWLDGGGTDPLLSFLNGTTATAEIKKGTNQFTLFTHWYVAFGRIYGCTQAENFVDQKYRTLTPAYVHKYMDLNSPQIAYFIRQIIIASSYYGFSDGDAKTLETFMNARYNTKCAPAQDNQLYSICLSDQGCSLAAPKADCAAYANVKPYGTAEDTTTTAPPVATGSSPPSASSSTSQPASLSGGVIAGIAVGAAVGVALLVGIVWFFLKKRNRNNDPATRPQSLAVSQMTGGGGYHQDPGMYSPQMSQNGYYDPNRQSQFTTSHPVHGRESPYFISTPRASPSPGHGWAGTEMKPQELDSADITWMPTSPTTEIMPQSVVGSLHHTPELQQPAEMESPYQGNWGPQTIHEGSRDEQPTPQNK